VSQNELVDAVTRQKWLAELASKVSAARVRTEPFPYIVINDFLPDALYRTMLASWPPEHAFMTTNYAKRWQIDLTPYTAQSEQPAHPIWREILELSDPINRALFRKLDPHFHVKFHSLLGSDWKQAVRKNFHISFRQAQLLQYPGDGGLHPHVDSARLVVNSFLYMSELDEVEPELGTILYRTYGFSRPENNAKLTPKLEEKLLAPDVIIPYRRNSLFSFVNAPHSFHGVRDFEISPRQRRVVVFSPVIRENEAALLEEFRKRPPTLDDGD